jgi:hypothetical protein
MIPMHVHVLDGDFACFSRTANVSNLYKFSVIISQRGSQCLTGHAYSPHRNRHH